MNKAKVYHRILLSNGPCPVQLAKAHFHISPPVTSAIHSPLPQQPPALAPSFWNPVNCCLDAIPIQAAVLAILLVIWPAPSAIKCTLEAPSLELPKIKATIHRAHLTIGPQAKIRTSSQHWIIAIIQQYWDNAWDLITTRMLRILLGVRVWPTLSKLFLHHPASFLKGPCLQKWLLYSFQILVPFGVKPSPVIPASVSGSSTSTDNMSSHYRLCLYANMPS